MQWRRRKRRRVDFEWSCLCIGVPKRDPSSKFRVSVKHQYIPDEYSTWDQHRQQMWVAIPFNANDYYMKYLPPGIPSRPAIWSEEEKQELLETTKLYHPNGKWGLFSLHFLGRTGEEVSMNVYLEEWSNE